MKLLSITRSVLAIAGCYLIAIFLGAVIVRWFEYATFPISFDGLFIIALLSKYPTLLGISAYTSIFLYEHLRDVSLRLTTLILIGGIIGIVTPVTLYFESYFLGGPWGEYGRVFPEYYTLLWGPFLLLGLCSGLLYKFAVQRRRVRTSSLPK